MGTDDWLRLDLHIHTLDDPKDSLDYSAQELLERARACRIEVLAITLHDAVFDRPEVFAAAWAMGLLLIPAAEMRLEGADIVLLNVSAAEAESLRDFDDVRALRARRGETLFTFAPHPFYLLGGSIGGEKLRANLDCFDAIEWCHFHRGKFNPNRPAARLAEESGKPLLATSDAHRLGAFGRHYTEIPRPAELSVETVFAGLRAGPRRLISPACTLGELLGELWFIFIHHPVRALWRGNTRKREP